MTCDLNRIGHCTILLGAISLTTFAHAQSLRFDELANQPFTNGFLSKEAIATLEDLGFAIPRIFKDDTPEDTKAIQPVLNQIMFYPLSEFDGKMKTTDWSKLPHFPGPKSRGREETHWVVPETFFDQLAGVMKAVPPLPGEEALYKWIGSVLDAAAKDPAVKQCAVGDRLPQPRRHRQVEHV